MMKTVLILALVFADILSGREVPYINYKAVKIGAQTLGNLNNILEKLHNIDILSKNLARNSTIAIIPPHRMGDVFQVISTEKAVINILENNLQDYVDEEFRLLNLRRGTRQSNTLEDSLEEYLDLDEIYEFQDLLVSSCTTHTRLKKKTIGYSANNRPINVLQISNQNSTSNKKTIFIEAGIHAREWLSPAAANYIIYQLACEVDNNDLLELFNFEVIPVLNPDGFQYTHEGHRYWRNNRQSNNGSECIGTDINRNFEIGFGRTDGASSDMCDENYSGDHPYSTPEAEALRDYVQSINDNIVSYLALHTFGQYILLLWSYKGGQPQDYHNLVDLASIAVEAMGISFEIGSGYSLIYPASGTSHDFAREKARVALTFVWELMPDSDHGYEGFSPGEGHLPVYTQTVWRGVRAYVQAVADQVGQDVQKVDNTL